MADYANEKRQDHEHTSIAMQHAPLHEKHISPPTSPVVRQEEAPPSRLAVLGAVSFYMVAALVMVRQTVLFLPLESFANACCADIRQQGRVERSLCTDILLVLPVDYSCGAIASYGFTWLLYAAANKTASRERSHAADRDGE